MAPREKQQFSLARMFLAVFFGCTLLGSILGAGTAENAHLSIAYFIGAWLSACGLALTIRPPRR